VRDTAVMDRTAAVHVLERLHDAQNQFYGGGDATPLAELLATDVTWTVPGRNRIAGAYHGQDEVFGYFRRRREVASATFQLHRTDILVGEGDRLAALTDGTATIAGCRRHWSTVGLYRIAAGRIAACWLLPLDPAEFDDIWSR
jgi:ketosteroid isomerase-like protein